ncbi:hypothetical protein J2R76_005815 [Bradyrhizobium sp. USDA 4532]|nr:hypothetical protein [Bradyrhizobium sp. USDA 4545]MCP1922224.1 hypothetical protein [Bradyrhizobium sp. USDA 4532]
MNGKNVASLLERLVPRKVAELNGMQESRIYKLTTAYKTPDKR